uniref:Peptidase M12A domain-containing protein n=1 Tax=Magallana gigas TaxID=29159 RepID=A0A8W8J5Y2_MAGGI
MFVDNNLEGSSVFYNGDIVLDKKAADMMYGTTSRRRKRATTRMKDRLWKNGVLYYQFDPSLSRLARKAVKQAMEHIFNKTCVVFKKKRKKNPDYVRFISEPEWARYDRDKYVEVTLDNVSPRYVDDFAKISLTMA